MKAQVALLLCSLFILSVFIIDFKRKPKVSYALWIPLIWMMIIGSRMVSYWLNTGGISASPEAYLQGSPIDRGIFTALIIAGLLILFKRKINWAQIFRNNTWVLILLLFSAISILWSDFPWVSFKRWIKAAGNPIMVLVVLTDPYPADALKAIFRRFTYVLVPMSIVLIKYFPELGRTYHRYSDEVMFTGVATGKNGLGLLCMVSGIYFFWNLLTMWRNKNSSVDKKELYVNILFLLMIAWLLMKADSLTPLINLIIGISIVAAFELKIIKRNAGHLGRYVLISLLCISPFLIFGSSSIFSSFIDITGHSDTFWGRVDLWPELIDLMSGSPLIGNGYGGFWLGERMSTLWETYWWHPTEAHNGYVETYLELGYIGIVLLLALVISSYQKITRTLTNEFEFGRLSMAFFTVTLFFNIAESAFKGLHLMWFIFLLITIEGASRITSSQMKTDPLSHTRTKNEHLN